MVANMVANNKLHTLDGKIRPHRFGGEGVLIGGQQQH